MNTLYFEGAGWESAEHNGVGNCRIGATFPTKNGECYLEITGHRTHKHTPENLRHYSFLGHVSHIYLTKDEKTCYSTEFNGLNGKTFEYSKPNILKLVNSLEVGADFDSMEVINDGSYSRFTRQDEIKKAGEK